MSETEFIKLAEQLRTTPADEVVKVAGILNRLKNLFKKITNPEYRRAVEDMQLEGGAMADAGRNLNKQIKELTRALKEGDIHNYRKAKSAIENALNEFLYAKQNADQRANKIWEYTLQEYKTPGFVDRYVEHYKKRHPDYDVEFEKKYEGHSLRDFMAFRNVKDLFIYKGEGRGAAKVLIDYVAQSLASLYEPKDRAEFIKKNFSGPQLDSFLNEFSNAVLLGELEKVFPYKPGPKQKVPVGTNVLVVKSLPFEVPGLDVNIQATVLLKDDRGDISKPANISLMNTKEVEFLGAPNKTTERGEVKEEPGELQQEIEKEVVEQVEEQVASSLEEESPPFNWGPPKGPIKGNPTPEEMQHRQEIISKIPEFRVPGYKKYEPPKNLGDLEMTPDSANEPEQSVPPTLSSVYLDTLIKNADQVPYKTTKLSEKQFADVMRRGYQIAFGSDPTLEVLGAGWAQAVLESGRPINLPNNNVGNIKATSSWIKSGGQYFARKTGEFSPDGKAYVHEDAKWRAYSTPEEGAAGYWKFLGDNFGKAVDWMKAGDPESASVVLGLNKYYTASISKYAGAVGKIYNEFMKRIAPELSDLQSKPEPQPGPKPQVKKWSADYSDDEKNSILHSKQETVSDDVEVDTLINKLVASPLTNMVKRSIVKNNVGRSTALVMLNSLNANSVEQIEFARVASSILDSYLDIDARVCKKGDIIQIKCSGAGSEMVIAGAIQAVCDMVAAEMKRQTGINIYPSAIAGSTSVFAEIESDAIIKNRKKFNMKRVVNG